MIQRINVESMLIRDVCQVGLITTHTPGSLLGAGASNFTITQSWFILLKGACRG